MYLEQGRPANEQCLVPEPEWQEEFWVCQESSDENTSYMFSHRKQLKTLAACTSFIIESTNYN